MRFAVVTLGKVCGEYMMAEECCIGTAPKRKLSSLLMEMATVLHQQGHVVDYIDFSIDNNATLDNYDVVVYFVFLHFYKEITSRIKGMVNDNQYVIGVAAPPGYALQFLLSSDIPDAMVFANPEHALLTLPDDKDLLPQWAQDTDGVVERKRQNTTFPKNMFHKSNGIDYRLLPSYYWDKYNAVVYQVARGCPYRCKFCLVGGSTVTDKTFRMRSADIVARDINQIRTLAGRNVPLGIFASQVTTDINWLRRFRDLMKDKPYRYAPNINLRELTKEKAILLKESGAFRVVAGAEALTDSMLKIMNKPHSYDDIVRCVGILEGVGLNYVFHLRCGVGEQVGDVNKSMRALRDLSRIMKRGYLDLAPIVYYQGAEAINDIGGDMISHENCKASKAYFPIRKDTPFDAWGNFAKEAIKLKLLRSRGLKFFGKWFVTKYGISRRYL